LVRYRNYVLLSRFSAKEERRRLTAAPLLQGQLGSEWIGIENHLNYIHRPGGSLSPEEALGLSIVFNSAFMDTYFRVLNGSTQVSATEIRKIPLPPLELIVDIGRRALHRELDDSAVEELARLALAEPPAPRSGIKTHA
jgi:adenine-specific DNA-methyltransferase